MLKLSKLEIKNFGMLKDIVLDFTGKEVVGILAEYANAPKRSNMAGKSLISEAIRYLLVGITRYKKETMMIHYDESVMWVKGVFLDNNNKKYILKRGRDRANNGILELDWIEKTRESQEAISNIFGVYRDDFDLTNFFKQSDINGFMNKSPSEKTSYLQKAMKNDHWKDKCERVKEDIKHLNLDLKENTVVKNSLEESLEVDEELKIEVCELKKINKKLKITCGVFVDELSELRSSILESEKSNMLIEEKIRGLKKDIRGAEESAVKLDNIKIKIESCENKIKTSKDSVKELDYTRKEAEKEIVKFNIKLSEKTKMLSVPSSGGMCPILEEECDRISLSKQEIKNISEDKKKYLSKLKKLDNKINVLDKNDKTKRFISDTEASLKNYRIRLSDIENNSSDFLGTKKKIFKLKNKLVIVNEKKIEKIEELEDKIEESNDFVNRNNSKISVLSHRIKEAEKSLEKIDMLHEKNEKLVSKIEKLKYVQMMFGKSGILADEIENAFQEIQDDINYILKELDCNLTVSFSPDKELNKKEPVCSCGFVYYKNYKKGVCEECGIDRRNSRKEEISLKVIDQNGNEADFSGGSGGEKSIISYAVRIALTMFKRRQNQCQLNILFLDEIDSALDDHLAKSIVNSITNVLTKKLGYDQIIMISHKPEIKNSVPNIIKVIRHKNYSTAKFV